MVFYLLFMVFYLGEDLLSSLDAGEGSFIKAGKQLGSCFASA